MRSNKLKVLKKVDISGSKKLEFLPKNSQENGSIDLILSGMSYGLRRGNYIYFVDVCASNHEGPSGIYPLRDQLELLHDREKEEKRFEEYKDVYLNSP